MKNNFEVSIPDPIHAAIGKINQTIVAVVAVLVIGFITMLLMVSGLVLDAWRFKSNSYEGLIETIRSQEKIISDNEAQRLEVVKSLGNIQAELQKKADKPQYAK